MVRWVIVLTAVAAQAGCSTMRPVESPGPFIASRNPGVVVIIEANGKATEVATPKLLADTVFGYNAEGDEVTIPVSQVRQMIAPQISTTRTALLGAAVTAATVFLATAILGKGDDPAIPPPEGEPEDYLAPTKPAGARSIPLLRFRIGW